MDLKSSDYNSIISDHPDATIGLGVTTTFLFVLSIVFIIIIVIIVCLYCRHKCNSMQ